MSLQNNPYPTVAVLGYGSQGRAQALNLRDSGWNVQLGLRPNGARLARALADGFAPLPLHESVEGADLVAVLLPDMTHAEVVNATLPHLQRRVKCCSSHTDLVSTMDS